MTISNNSCTNPTHGSNRMKCIALRKYEKCIDATISTESIIETTNLQKQMNPNIEQIGGHQYNIT